MSETKEKPTKAEKEAKEKLAEIAKNVLELRRERELYLHLSGASYRQIADQISKSGEKVSKSTVERDVNKMLDAMDKEETAVVVSRVRKVQKNRLNQLILAHWQAAVGGNLKSGYFVRQLMKDMTDLYGADAPGKMEHEHNFNPKDKSDEELQLIASSGGKG